MSLFELLICALYRRKRNNVHHRTPENANHNPFSKTKTVSLTKTKVIMMPDAHHHLCKEGGTEVVVYSLSAHLLAVVGNSRRS